MNEKEERIGRLRLGRAKAAYEAHARALKQFAPESAESDHPPFESLRFSERMIWDKIQAAVVAHIANNGCE